MKAKYMLDYWGTSQDTSCFFLWPLLEKFGLLIKLIRKYRDATQYPHSSLASLIYSLPLQAVDGLATVVTNLPSLKVRIHSLFGKIFEFRQKPACATAISHRVFPLICKFPDLHTQHIISFPHETQIFLLAP